MFHNIITSLTGQLFIVLLGLAIVSACNIRPASEDPPQNDLVNTQWVLKKIQGHDGEIKRLPELRFSEKRLSGFNGCNRIFSNYATGSDRSIAFGQTGSTRMACIDNAGEVERKFNIALQGTRFYALSTSELNLLDPKRKVLMVFTPKPLE